MSVRSVIGFSLPLVTLTACAPVPITPERAERLCREDAGLADGVRGSVGVGVGTSGARAKGSITVTNRVLNPQSEEDFIRDCVDRRLAGEAQPATIGITIGGRT